MAVAAASNALITTTEYATVFGAITGDEDKYQTLINQASARIESFVRRPGLKATDYTGATALILDGSGTSEIVVPRYPVNSITHLYIDSERAFGADTEITSSEYVFYADSGIISLLETVAPELPGVVKIECNAGFATTNGKWALLQSACLELVRWMSGRIGATGGIGIRTISNAEGGSTTWETDMPANVRSMLEAVK